MLSPIATGLSMLCVGIFLLVVIPLLDASERFGKYISLRYTLIVLCAMLGLGVVVDFSHLETSTRNLVLVATFILIGMFIVVRTMEKGKIHLRKKIELEAKKGDLEGSIKISEDPEAPPQINMENND